MKDNNVYRKMDNGRYVPVGIYCGDDRCQTEDLTSFLNFFIVKKLNEKKNGK